MQGKPLYRTREQRDDWDRWFKRDLERRRQPSQMPRNWLLQIVPDRSCHEPLCSVGLQASGKRHRNKYTEQDEEHGPRRYDIGGGWPGSGSLIIIRHGTSHLFGAARDFQPGARQLVQTSGRRPASLPINLAGSTDVDCAISHA